MTNALLSAIFTLVLVLLQIIFGLLLKKHKKAFLKYHKALGVFIFIVILANIILFPVVSIIGIIVLLIVAVQVVLGILISKGKRNLLKFHRPLGISVFILVIANLVLATINY